jgi:SAM-dependent methyltransferase
LRILQKKLIRSLRQEGLRGTVQAAARKLRQAAAGLRPTVRRARRAHREAEAAFDAKYGVQTAGLVSLAELSIDSGNWEHGARYQPINPGEFREMMRAAGAVARERTFVDFGCGKGRALFLAAEHPFDEIVGIEFSSALAETARRNIAAYRNPAQNCRRISVVAGDAAEYEIPDVPLVLFFYNPFTEPVMARVVENVRRSVELSPRPITVIYNTPEHSEPWERLATLRRGVCGPDFVIYHDTATAYAGGQL